MHYFPVGARMRFAGASAVFVIACATLASSQVTFNGVGTNIQWQLACDYDGHDFKNIRIAPDRCGPACADDSRCTHFAWSNYNGGTCWMKTDMNGQKAKYVTDRSMVCGWITSRAQVTGSQGHEITVVNNCPFTVWPGTWGQNNNIPYSGGWMMQSQASTSFTVPRGWTAGRIWGRTGCTGFGNQLQCKTGDCGGRLQCNGATGVPPATLAEFTMDGAGGQDFYDISNVDGYNLPMRIDVTGSFNTPIQPYFCTYAGCQSDLNAICPQPLQVKQNGNTVACKSACEALNQDMYCCRGAYNTPQTCNPARWPVNYAAVFKRACPRAYSYAYDDETSTFRCSGSNTNYKVTFCP